MTDPLLRPTELPVLNGSERFDGLDATVLDFWRWALGDLRMNNARGYLVEYLIARAVGSTDQRRIEWGAQDVTAPDGTKIEVKSTGYLQSWTQRKPSTPSFSFTGAKSTWDDKSGTWSPGSEGRVDVWVFALHTCKDHASYRPLAVDQWIFWAVPHAVIEDLGQKTGGLATIERIAGSGVQWADLRSAIASASASAARPPRQALDHGSQAPSGGQ